MTSKGTAFGLPDAEGRTWLRACPVDEVLEDEGLALPTEPPTAVFVSGGEYFCIDDTCTHETYSLAQGWVEDCVVECSLHMAKFCLRSGAAMSPPASEPVAVHPVAVVGGDVFVALPTAYVVTPH